MTNYDKWKKFDNDSFVGKLESEAQEEEQSKGSIFLARQPDLVKQSKVSVSTSVYLKKSIEIAESKGAVDALKASGRNRRRNKENITSNSPNIAVEGTNKGQIATVDQALHRFIDLLGSLSADVDKLQALTEKKRFHKRGMVAALKILRNIEELDLFLPVVLASGYCSEESLEEVRNSIDTLLKQTLACSSLFALSCGYFSTASEICRVLLKCPDYEKQAGFWIIRALAFAGIGNSYLCYLHLKSAVSLTPSYPGLTQYVDHFEQDMTSLIRKTDYTSSVHMEVIRASFFSLTLSESFLNDCPDLSRVCLADLLSLGMDQINYSLSSMFGTNEEILVNNYDEMFETSSIQFFEYILIQFSRLYSLSKDHHRLFNIQRLTSKKLALFVAHRLFYEGQILYLESLFGTAEVKYAASVSLLADILSSEGEAAEAWTSKIKSILSVALINLGMCRYHRNKFIVSSGKDSDTGLLLHKPFQERLLLLENLSLLDIFQLSFTILPNPVSKWKEIEMLEELSRFDEASVCVETLEILLQDKDGSDSLRSDLIVGCPGLNTQWSQINILGQKSFVRFTDLPNTTASTESQRPFELTKLQGLIDSHLQNQIDNDDSLFWGGDERNASKPWKLSSVPSAVWQELIRLKRRHISHRRDKLGVDNQKR